MLSSYKSEEKYSRFRQYQTKSIISCVTTITVQNVLQLAVCTILHVSPENYEQEPLCRGGSKRERGSQELISYSILRQ